MTKAAPTNKQVYVANRIWTEFCGGGLRLHVAAKPDCLPEGDFIGALSDAPLIQIAFKELGIINQERVFQAIESHGAEKKFPPLSLPSRPLVVR